MNTSCVVSPALVQDTDEWTTLLDRIPADLAQTAFASLALLRRTKHLPNAATLLRLILGYATGLSMPQVTTWAAHWGLATLTPEALHARIAHADHWLRHLVTQVLAARCALTAQPTAPWRIHLLNGTHVARPGVTSTDWRVHLGLNLRTLTVDDALLTSYAVGERLTRLARQPHDLLVGDRVHAVRAAIAEIQHVGAQVLVRITPSNFPLQTREGEPLDPVAIASQLAPGDSAEWDVATVPTKDGTVLTGRIIVRRFPDTAVARAERRQARRRSRQCVGQPTVATRTSWRYLVLFTTLTAAQLPQADALALYRFRWQIELAIKRYKSLLGFAQLKTRTDACCRTVLWAKLLLLLLTEDLAGLADAFPP